MIHLILHKVRGEPAFDIAERCGMCKEPCQPQCGLWPGCQNEEWWIIPTSGHTAYPYKTWPIDPMRFQLEGIPPEWPDHYAVSQEPVVKQPSFDDILGGLIGKFPRRA